MIKNLWSKVRLVCGNHEYDPDKLGTDHVHMEPHEAATSNISRQLYSGTMNMFYSCPKYYPENRDKSEPECRNHISMKEYEDMLATLSNYMEDSLLYGTDANITGVKWKSKRGVRYEVLKCTEKHIDVLCVNDKALWNKS